MPPFIDLWHYGALLGAKKGLKKLKVAEAIKIKSKARRKVARYIKNHEEAKYKDKIQREVGRYAIGVILR